MSVDAILGFFKDHWDIIAKVLGPILGAAVAYNQRRFFIRPRSKLKTDLEVLDLLKEEEVKADREKIRKSIANQVEQIYGKTARIRTERNYWLFGFGIFWALAFSSFTFFISQSRDWSNWWCILTGFLAMAGLGWMIAGWEGKTSEGGEESDLTTIEVPTEIIPQVKQLIAKHEEAKKHLTSTSTPT